MTASSSLICLIFCLLSGHHLDFTAEELKNRYGSHDEYVAQVRSTMQQPVEDGYVLPLTRTLPSTRQRLRTSRADPFAGLAGFGEPQPLWLQSAHYQMCCAGRRVDLMPSTCT
ncbi:alpha/beta hydrolase domain-containing protein [Mesorhizobium sp. ISC25]|uniref:alpha/beta hydrolase domain-containing protein n=1 Tax=Mesorhizobium sp. ISC25 TaxID=3077335 RepID=UPI0035D5EEEC